jgi:hypothetical protein
MKSFAHLVIAGAMTASLSVSALYGNIVLTKGARGI